MSIADKLQQIADIKVGIKDAIIEKGVEVGDKFSDYPAAISAISCGGGGGSAVPKWTGHADAAGLREIGWDDDDIAYYQEHGVKWNEEEDDQHLVSDFDKWVATQINASNYADSRWTTHIVYLPKFDTSKVTDMSRMFSYFNSLVSIPQLDTSNVTNMSNMFSGCYSLVSIPQLDTSNVTDMSYMFYNCYSLVSIPQLDTSKVTDMSNMFSYCNSLVSIPQLDTSKVTNMNATFSYCYSLVSIPQLDTSKVTNMNSMFSGCYSLVSIPQLDTSSVTIIGAMFYCCYSLVSIPQLDTSSVTSMNTMFSGCYSLVSIPQLDTSKVTAMSSMFANCRSLVSIPQLDTSKVTNMNSMFSGCYLKKSQIGIKVANQYPTICCFDGESVISILLNAKNTSTISHSLYLSYPAAKYVYEHSITDDYAKYGFTPNDGSKSAQTWLAENAAKNIPNLRTPITLSWASGSSDYIG